MNDAIYFDRYELRPSERRLLRDGQSVPLRAKAFDLLAVLASRPGQLVSKDELLSLVWPGLAVEENNIAAQMVALRKVLPGELIVTVPGRGYRFNAGPQEASAPVLVPPQAQRPGAAPAAGPVLFGRERDLQRLRAALVDPGCVTLVGPGGVGKTSLALALCAAAGDIPCWVDLVPLGTGDALLPSVARALGTQVGDGGTLGEIAGALQAARWLVLDNAEHLRDEVAALVPQLLDIAPGLHLLVTSQVPLSTHGERVERIEPLELPASDVPDAQAAGIGAVAMFIDRVRAADSRYRFEADSLPRVRLLCAELDGLPLALEMAAARVPLLGLGRVHDALAERFAMLRRNHRDTPTRQRTLHAALDWSYGLLARGEQRLFRQLAVFSHGFSLDLLVDMEHDQDSWATIDGLALLVERSLVSVDHGREPPRYRLLETMRTYALEQLIAAGEEEAARLCYAEALARLFEADYEVSHERPDPPVLACDDELGNARDVLSWALQHRPSLAARLAAHAAYTGSWTHWSLELYGWLSACRPVVEGDQVDLPGRALYWRHMAAQTLIQGQREQALEFCRRATTVCREAGNDSLLFNALSVLGRAILVAGEELTQATAEFNDLAQRHPEWSQPWVRVLTLDLQAHARQLDDQPEAALALVHEAVELARASGLVRVEAYTTINHARLLRDQNRGEDALRVLRAWLESMATSPHAVRLRRFSNVTCRALICRILCELDRFDEALADASMLWTDTRHGGVPATVESVLALGLAKAGRLRAAAVLVGHLRQYFVGTGAPGSLPADDIERATALAIAGLGESAVARLTAEGSGLDDAAVRQLLVAAAEPGAPAEGAVA